MFKKIIIASLLVLALAVPIAGIAIAQQDGQKAEGRRGGRKGKGMAGIVTSVNAATDEFSIENRAGETITFQVNPDTKFLSPDGQLDSFDDLAVDMLVGVKAAGNEEGTLVAKGVKWLDPALADAERAGGEVTAISASSFTVINRDGEEFTFQVDEDTKFMSRDGSLESLDDLEEGMKVGVVYLEQEDGSLLAKGVKEMKPHRGRPNGQRGEGPPAGADGTGRPNNGGNNQS